MTGEPSREQVKEAFLRAANRGDFDVAAKIAVYGVLSSPLAADRFAEGLLNSALASRDRICPVCGAPHGAGPEACPVCQTARRVNEKIVLGR